MNTKIFHLVPASSISLWTFAVLIIFLIAMLAVFARFVYWSKYTTYEVSDQSLVINGGMWGRSVDRGKLLLEDAEVVNLKEATQYGLRIRTSGIGMPGYKSGWYRLRNDEKALVFITDQSRVVRIPTTEEYTLMMTVEEPEAFLASLR